jgi:hypothetical protein
VWGTEPGPVVGILLYAVLVDGVGDRLHFDLSEIPHASGCPVNLVGFYPRKFKA